MRSIHVSHHSHLIRGRTVAPIPPRWRAGFVAVALGLALGASAPCLATDIESVLGIGAKENEKSVESQKRIEKIDDKTDAMATEYRAILAQIDSLKVYNRQLEKLISAQDDELASLDDQIANVTVIGREITPMMLRMVDALGEFIDLDVPLLLTERRDRLARLRETMDRADVANSEKYRAITEAYQIENEYGRTIEAYQATLTMDGEERTLDFLRVGRIALLYTTLDGNEIGAWDARQKQWVKVPDDFKDSIRSGIRIARKQAAPDMIRLPIAAPEDAGK